jgi:hypothetical protein
VAAPPRSFGLCDSIRPKSSEFRSPCAPVGRFGVWVGAAGGEASLTALCPAASRNDIPPQFSGLVGFDNIFVAMVTVRHAAAAAARGQAAALRRHSVPRRTALRHS